MPLSYVTATLAAVINKKADIMEGCNAGREYFDERSPSEASCVSYGMSEDPLLLLMGCSTVQEIVGVVDFSYHVISTTSSSDGFLRSSEKHLDKQD